MPKFTALAERCRICANITFYIHPLVILFLERVFSAVFSWNLELGTLLFLLTSVICLSIGFTLSNIKVVKKIV